MGVFMENREPSSKVRELFRWSVGCSELKELSHSAPWPRIFTNSVFIAYQVEAAAIDPGKVLLEVCLSEAEESGSGTPKINEHHRFLVVFAHNVM